MTLINTYLCNAQSTDLHKTYSFAFRNVPLQDVIRLLGDETSLVFSYSSEVLKNKSKINCTFHEEPLSDILYKLFSPQEISYTYIEGYIILKNEIRMPQKILLEGTILEHDTMASIPYATVSVKNRTLGTIADNKGYFEIILDSKYADDTAIFSSMGYESFPIPVRELSGKKNLVIRLKKQFIPIPPVEISPEDFEILNSGNQKKKSKGSLYIDTQGQQAAIFLENHKGREGRLLKIQYYLSDEGNTEAPFRVRIYRKEKETGKPGKDMLPEIIVVKPGIESGWYNVDLRTYNIEFPSEGLFVAMEGIFPNDYEYYSNENEFVDIGMSNKSEMPSLPSSISYGQRLGYNKNAGKNTWHYSFSHTWFQLDNQKYGVMISADVQYRKTKREKNK